MREHDRIQIPDHTLKPAIDALLPRMELEEGNEEKAKSALAYTLRMYAQVLPKGELQPFLDFLRTATPTYTLFASPEILHYTMEYFRNAKTYSLPDFPVFDTGLVREKRDHFQRLVQQTRKFNHQGYMIFPQSPASALPFWLIRQQAEQGSFHRRDDPTLRTLDLCGAPGNKSFNLFNFPGIDHVDSVINDIDPTRLQRVADRLLSFGFEGNFDRTIFSGVLSSGTSVEVTLTNIDARNTDAVQRMVDAHFNGLPSNITIADVHCPCDGILWKDPSAGETIQMKKPHQSISQFQILANALEVTAPEGSGIVSYSTCSVSGIVNEGVVSHALEQNPQARTLDLATNDTILFPQIGEFRGYRFHQDLRAVRSYPHTLGGGFFCALLVTS